MASVEQRVIDIVAEQLGGKDQITRETSFVNDLGADSLDTVELVMELEEEFDINIPDDVAEKIQTVGQAIDHIRRPSKAPKPPLPESLHETPRRRHGYWRRHLARLQGGGALARICKGESGIGLLERLDVTAFRVRFGGEIRNWSAEGYIDAKDIKRFDRFVQFARSPASMPWATPASTSRRKTPGAAA